MMLWILTVIASFAGLLTLVLTLHVIKRLRNTAVGRMLFLALVFLAFSALTHMVAAVYLALSGYGREVAIPPNGVGVYSPLRAEYI